jgi:hypothetical protein
MKGGAHFTNFVILRTQVLPGLADLHGLVQPLLLAGQHLVQHQPWSRSTSHPN